MNLDVQRLSFERLHQDSSESLLIVSLGPRSPLLARGWLVSHQRRSCLLLQTGLAIAFQAQPEFLAFHSIKTDFLVLFARAVKTARWPFLEAFVSDHSARLFAIQVRQVVLDSTVNRNLENWKDMQNSLVSLHGASRHARAALDR